MTKIELDKERYIHFTLNAMEKFEDVTDKSIFSLDTEKMKIKDLKTLIWAGLNETEEIDIEKVGKLISLENMDILNKAIEEEFRKAMPEKKTVIQEENKK